MWSRTASTMKTTAARARASTACPTGGYPLLDVDLSHEPDVAKVERLHARILQSTAADGPALKRAAAGSAAGRKCSQPIRHVALGWPADERPSWDDMESAADSWLEATGLTEHRVVLVGHREPGKADHLHLVICMVHPETGKVPKVNLARVGSRWAEAWERAHDRIVIPTRVARNAARRAAAEAHARGDSAGARAAFAQFPATEATRSNGRGKLPPAGRAAYAALRQEQEVEVAALRSLLRAEDASRREESRRIAALKKKHRRAADDLARAYRNGAVAVDEVAPAPQPERATTTTTPVAAAVDEPAPPPRELEAEPEAKPTLTADQRRAAMEARSRLHNRWPEPEGIPLSTESLQRAAELLHNGDEVDLVGAHVLERTAVLRDRAAREKSRAGGVLEDGRRGGRADRRAHRDRAHPLPGSTGPDRPGVPARAANGRHHAHENARIHRRRPRRPGAGRRPGALERPKPRRRPTSTTQGTMRTRHQRPGRDSSQRDAGEQDGAVPASSPTGNTPSARRGSRCSLGRCGHTSSLSIAGTAGRAPRHRPMTSRTSRSIIASCSVCCGSFAGGAEIRVARGADAWPAVFSGQVDPAG